MPLYFTVYVGEKLSLGLDYGANGDLVDNVSIAQSTWQTVAGITRDSESISGTKVMARFEPTAPGKYKIWNTAVTSSTPAETLKDFILLIVKKRAGMP